MERIKEKPQEAVLTREVIETNNSQMELTRQILVAEDDGMLLRTTEPKTMEKDLAIVIN